MSKIKADSLATRDDSYSVPTETLARAACRAWVNFDGTTTPPTIRASFNVSSVVRNSTGVYTVNFGTSMVDADYAVSALVGAGSASVGIMLSESNAVARTPDLMRVYVTRADNGNQLNVAQVGMAFFR